MASAALARAWERLFVYGYGSVLRREILLQHDILIIFGQAIQGKLLDSGCRRDEDAGQWRYAQAHAYIQTTRLLWRRVSRFSQAREKQDEKGKKKIRGYLLQQHADHIRKEYRVEARQANPREIVNSILHESLYLPEGEIKRYICIRDCNVQVHINGEGKQEHVSCICGRRHHVRIHTMQGVSAQDSCRLNQRRVGQESFNSKDSIEEKARVHVS